jgi:hypothetical protein
MALEPQCGGAAGPIAIIPETQVPLLTISSRWEQVFVLPNKAALEAVLVTYLPTCGWFGGRQRPLGAVRVQEELRILCDLHLLEKAIYELGYELEHRPDWVRLPLRGILQLLERAS